MKHLRSALPSGLFAKSFVIALALLGAATVAMATRPAVAPPGQNVAPPVGGSGTASYVPRFITGSTVGNSNIFDTGTSVGINDNTPTAGIELDVAGEIRATGSITAGSFLYSSDARLKENIRTLAGALADILSLRGVSYEWKDKTRGTGQELGFVAQEVEAVAPSLVRTSAEGYKTVDYARVVPLLVEAIKEQQHQIDILKADIQALKAAR